MHMHRDPQTMQVLPMQGDVLSQVVEFLQQQSECLQALGWRRVALLLTQVSVLAKSPEQNLHLLAHQRDLLLLGLGVLAGWSRKSTLGHIIGDGGAAAPRHVVAEGRLIPSVVAAVMAAQQGAHVVRVHDVRETCQALAVWQAVKSQRAEG